MWIQFFNIWTAVLAADALVALRRWRTQAVLIALVIVGWLTRKLRTSELYKTAASILLAVDHYTGDDVTNVVRAFYCCDPTLTVASLCRWFGLFGPVPTTIDIVFMSNGAIHAARFELQGDTEMLTGRATDDGDIALGNIPSHAIHRAVKV